MADKVIKPKPGVYKGVQYRSQLEISWAKYFDQHKLLRWWYKDKPCWDFQLQPQVFAFETLEVKPKCISLVVDAIHRWLHMFDNDEDFDYRSIIATVLCGPPPSRYGLPCVLCAIRTEYEYVLLMCSTFHGFIVHDDGEVVGSKLYERTWYLCTSCEDIEFSVSDYLFGEEGEPDGTHS